MTALNFMLQLLWRDDLAELNTTIMSRRSCVTDIYQNIKDVCIIILIIILLLLLLLIIIIIIIIINLIYIQHD